MTLPFSLRKAAAEAPEAMALFTPEGRWTYRRLWREVEPLAEQLLFELDTEHAQSASLDCQSLSAEPSLDGLKRLYAHLETERPLFLVHPRWPEAEARKMQDRVQAEELTPGDQILMATSGSTGPAKIVVHTQSSLSAAAAASARNLPLGVEDRWLLSLPFAHIGGLSIVLRCLLARATLVVEKASARQGLSACLKQHGVTHLSLVPTQLTRWLDAPDFDCPPSLQAVLVGGAPLGPTLRAEAWRRGLPVLATYGLTEMGSQVATERPRLGRPPTNTPGSESAAPGISAPIPAPGTVGPPLPSVEILLDSDGRLRVKGPSAMRRYLGLPSPFDDRGYFPTSDRAEILPDGCLRVLGRLDDAIITGGENVHPEVVEAALRSVPGLDNSYVVGVPDRDWGERIVAVVTGAPQPPQEKPDPSWYAMARQLLPSYAVPKEIRYLSELPLLASGKVDRRALRALLAEQVAEG